MSELAQYAVKESGCCGEVSPDGERICIKEEGQCPPHGWENEPGRAE